MSHLFEYDATDGILQSRLQGRVTSEELADFYRDAARYLALKHPRRGILDTTGVTSLEVMAQTVRDLASLQSGLADDSFVCVVVASAPDIYGTARMFELLEEDAHVNWHVVHTRRDALAILGVHDPRFVPIGTIQSKEENMSTAPTPQPIAVDPLKVDPKHYQVEFENDRVRILRVNYGSREKSVMHSHPASVAIFLTENRARFTFPDGKSEERYWEAGQSMFIPAEEHLPENLSDQPLELILIELKT
jgi:quercetin dioxygenase-like cupin family protein